MVHRPQPQPTSNQQPSLATLERPVRYRITLEPAACSPVEVPIGIYEPISHERVYGAVRIQVRTRFHIPGNWFAADILSQNGSARFQRKVVCVLTNKAAVGDVEGSVVPGASEDPQEFRIEQSLHPSCLVRQLDCGTWQVGLAMRGLGRFVGKRRLTIQK